MANKEKKTQEPQEKTPVQKTMEIKEKKASRARWAFRLIIVLLASALAFGIYHNLKKNQEEMRAKTNRPKSTFVAPRPTKVIPIKPDVIDIEVEAVEDHIQNKPTAAGDKTNSIFETTAKDKSLKEDEQVSNLNGTDQNFPDNEESSHIIVAPQEHADIIVVKPQTPDFVEADTETSSSLDMQNVGRLSFDTNETRQEKPIIPYVGYDPSKPHFTAKDALELRDNFLSEQPCGDDLRKLIMSDNQSQAAQDVIKDTSYFCFATTNVQNELKNLFLQSKKEALIRYYKEHDARWKYRLKKVFVSLVKIRNLNPTGDTVPDLLDRAHNALTEKNMTLTIETLAKLPDNLRPMFTEFMQKTNNFVKAKAALDALILSYAKGE